MADSYYLRLARWRQMMACDKRISPKASLAYRIATLVGDMAGHKGKIEVPAATLAEYVGTDRPTVSKLLNWVADLGYIEVIRTGGRDAITGERWPNTYKPVVAVADNFSLGINSENIPENGAGINSENNGAHVIARTHGHVIARTQESARKSGVAAHPPADAPAAALPKNISGNNYPTEFLNFLDLAGNKRGDAPIESVYENFLEMIERPGFDGLESAFAEYKRQLDLWEGRKRNKASYVAVFFQRYRGRIDAATIAKARTKSTNGTTRPAESGRPAGSAEQNALDRLGWDRALVLETIEDFRITDESRTESDQIRRLCATAAVRQARRSGGLDASARDFAQGNHEHRAAIDALSWGQVHRKLDGYLPAVDGGPPASKEFENYLFAALGANTLTTPQIRRMLDDFGAKNLDHLEASQIEAAKAQIDGYIQESKQAAE